MFRKVPVRSTVLGFLALLCVTVVTASKWIVEKLDPAFPGIRDHDWAVKFVFGAGFLATQYFSIAAARGKYESSLDLVLEFWGGVLERDPDARVTILRVRRYAWWERASWRWDEFWHGAKHHSREYLCAAGRAPPNSDEDTTLVKFHPGEGVAGIVWKNKNPLEVQNLPDYSTDREGWIRLSETLGLPAEKAELLHRRCRSYVCAPIFTGNDKFRLRGIICADSLQADAFDKKTVAAITQLGHYLGHLPF